jgi:hypothetical protein
MRKIAAGSVVLGCALFAASALATPPEKVHWSYTGQGISVVLPAPALCEFDVTLTVLVLEIDETSFYDGEHQLIMFHQHFVEQDAFTNEKNGKILIGELYTTNDATRWENGIPGKTFIEGVMQKVRLPDGSWYMLAGRLQWIEGIVLAPDHGTLKNVEGFCAALR